ncbi:hypothetical protein AKO1_003200 [Acrasis kona]|uniref:Uncharacterized protein n=1 Tax=Acrasis kona TaxID=1008807 RepID=A0AAW2YQW8_9EUKA
MANTYHEQRVAVISNDMLEIKKSLKDVEDSVMSMKERNDFVKEMMRKVQNAISSSHMILLSSEPQSSNV